MDTRIHQEHLEAELLEVMKAVKNYMRIHTILMLAATPLSLQEMVGGFEREVLIRDTLATLEQHGPEGSV